jgi:hypothetical protein
MNEREYYKRYQLRTERVEATERNLVASYPIYWQIRNFEAPYFKSNHELE